MAPQIRTNTHQVEKTAVGLVNQKKGMSYMDLSKVSTQELVEELRKREAVEVVQVLPYQDYRITVGDREIRDSGPALLLRVWD